MCFCGLCLYSCRKERESRRGGVVLVEGIRAWATQRTWQARRHVNCGVGKKLNGT